ncbi:hypothetical protein GS597_11570 [Synechococcales cyanobacterium C]|uniref:Uncharacterized protein n=1 Tax=Petrachloros mirabilis ULC683 TaxID=2781853 RepID=A0A8K2A8F0_9CYAN|nr:hypothetical protein [Petrachloros mirabilis]NCJ07134.1 hypothetical protein [Petrachloros mirabilis ULC683]
MDALTPIPTVPTGTVAHMAVPIRQLQFRWEPDYQMLACDDQVNEFQGAPKTEPSHDLTHLIIAACQHLPWEPQGPRELVCMAEYNAVLLENFFDKTCNAVIFGTTTDFETLASAVEYMDWFVNEHYAPFPTSAEAAFLRFCRFIDPFIVSRLFPYYLAVKRYERNHPDYRQAKYQFQFTSHTQPAVDEGGWLAQWSIYRQLRAAQSALGMVSSPQEFRVEQILKQVDQLLTDSPPAIAPAPHLTDELASRLATIEAQLTQIDHLNQRLAELEQRTRLPEGSGV